MMDGKTDVIAYAGYRGEETPRIFILDGWKVEVVEILRMWIEEAPQSRSKRRFFLVKGDDGSAHTLYYDEHSAQWFYRTRS